MLSYTDEVIRGEKNVVKCYEDRFDGITIDDKLREMLVNEDSENAYVFEDEEKDEFLFHIFKRVCVGGGICQPEETVDKYLDLTKLLYVHLQAHTINLIPYALLGCC